MFDYLNANIQGHGVKAISFIDHVGEDHIMVGLRLDQRPTNAAARGATYIRHVPIVTRMKSAGHDVQSLLNVVSIIMRSSTSKGCMATLTWFIAGL